MVEIIPGIIEDTWEPLKKRLQWLSEAAQWVHVDVSDGKFTPHKTWANPKDLSNISPPPLIEVHLMINEPWEHAGDWLSWPAVGRIIVHWEACAENPDAIRDMAAAAHTVGKEIVLALNPETAQPVEPFVSAADGVLVMGVHPGWSGAPFEQNTIEKVKALRAAYPDVTIGVDGGVNEERAPDLVKAGAQRLVSTSYIQSFSAPAEGIARLRSSIARAV